MNTAIIDQLHKILNAYKIGELGDTTMPEDTHPEFPDIELKRVYYTLPMALNYQRDSFKLWQAAQETFEDNATNDVFVLNVSSVLGTNLLREKLLKHKLALQPNKHVETWARVAETIYQNWESVTSLFETSDFDYLKLKELVQKKFKKGFPYLSGPKIFNYWAFIISTYGEVNLKNRSFIEIAPDTHIIQASIKLGVIAKSQASKLSREKISAIWREQLQNTGIDPIDLHSPLWFWSRKKFQYKL